MLYVFTPLQKQYFNMGQGAAYESSTAIDVLFPVTNFLQLTTTYYQ